MSIIFGYKDFRHFLIHKKEEKKASMPCRGIYAIMIFFFLNVLLKILVWSNLGA